MVARAAARLATLLLVTARARAAELAYQGAVAPPPAPDTHCQGWCPKWTCCRLCDDPACSGCGATKKCAPREDRGRGADELRSRARGRLRGAARGAVRIGRKTKRNGALPGGGALGSRWKIYM